MRNGNTPDDRSDLNKLCQFAIELFDDVRRVVISLPLSDEQSFTIEEVIEDAISALRAYCEHLSQMKKL